MRSKVFLRRRSSSVFLKRQGLLHPHDTVSCKVRRRVGNNQEHREELVENPRNQTSFKMDELSEDMKNMVSLLPSAGTTKQENQTTTTTTTTMTSMEDTTDEEIRSPTTATLTTRKGLPDSKRHNLEAATGWQLQPSSEEDEQRSETPVISKKNIVTPDTKPRRQANQRLDVATDAWIAKRRLELRNLNQDCRSNRRELPPASPISVTDQSNHHLDVATDAWVAKRRQQLSLVSSAKSGSSHKKKRKQVPVVTPEKDFSVASKATASWLAKHPNPKHDVNNNAYDSRKRRKVTIPDDVAIANKATTSWLAKKNCHSEHGKNDEVSKEKIKQKDRSKSKSSKIIPNFVKLANRPTFSFLMRKNENKKRLGKDFDIETGDEDDNEPCCPRFQKKMKKYKDRIKNSMFLPKNYSPSIGSRDSVACSISMEAGCTNGVFPEQHHYHKYTSCDDSISLADRSTTSWNLKKRAK